MWNGWVADHKHFYTWSIRHTFSIPLCHLSLIYFIFGCATSSLLCRLFSRCSEWGLLSGCSTRTSHCCGSSCRKAQSLGCVGVSSCGSQALEHRLSSWELSCSTAYEIFLAQGSNPCLLHWQVDSLPLSYQESPCHLFSKYILLQWYLHSNF